MLQDTNTTDTLVNDIPNTIPSTSTIETSITEPITIKKKNNRNFFFNKSNTLIDESNTTITARASTSNLNPPMFLRFRSSTLYITLTVALGILVDLASYGIVVPVLPFRLVELGYDNIGSKVGWLVSAYAIGLIISTPFIAYLGERIKSRRNPLIVYLLFMAGALVLFMQTDSYVAMIISRFLQGVSGTGIWTLGLALVTDSVPQERVGIVMGYVMIGFSIGSLLGPPLGGVLYNRLGYKAVFITALILVVLDLFMRLLVIEKHTALQWIERGVEIEGFEAIGYTEKLKEVEEGTVVKGEKNDSTEPNSPTSSISTSDTNLPPSTSTTNLPPPTHSNSNTNIPSPSTSSTTPPPASVLSGLKNLLTSPRAMSLFALTMLNGIVLGGLMDSGMTLYLESNYGLDSLGAGLVFIGGVAPSFIASPFAGWAADKYGAKPIAILGLLLSTPAYSLLIIQGPLALFVVFLIMVGFSLSFYLTPILLDLSLVVSLTPGLGAAHVYGIFNLAYSIGAFIGPIIAGQLIQTLQIRRGWVAICIISSGLSILLTPAVIFFVGGPLRSGKKVELEESVQKVEQEV